MLDTTETTAIRARVEELVTAGVFIRPYPDDPDIIRAVDLSWLDIYIYREIAARGDTTVAELADAVAETTGAGAYAIAWRIDALAGAHAPPTSETAPHHHHCANCDARTDHQRKETPTPDLCHACIALPAPIRRRPVAGPGPNCDCAAAPLSE